MNGTLTFYHKAGRIGTEIKTIEVPTGMMNIHDWCDDLNLPLDCEAVYVYEGGTQTYRRTLQGFQLIRATVR